MRRSAGPFVVRTVGSPMLTVICGTQEVFHGKTAYVAADWTSPLEDARKVSICAARIFSRCLCSRLLIPGHRAPVSRPARRWYARATRTPRRPDQRALTERE